jgi:hypothetical protein
LVIDGRLTVSDDRLSGVQDVLDRVECGPAKLVVRRCPRALVGEGFDGEVVFSVIGLVKEVP